MSDTVSISNLHLRYRLWIAEMNFDINVLRIFSDHLQQIMLQRNGTDTRSTGASFEKKFAELRREIDELRNEMHLVKMQLNSFSRENPQAGGDAMSSEVHHKLSDRYASFRQNFESVKQEVDQF
ncbi:MAG: hypothetical protein ACTHMM_26695 [Agriterribacter sp.]